MGPIVLLTGVLVLLYALATMLAGTAASASRGVEHSKRYSVVTAAVGISIAVFGLAMILR
jgi:hypothetical protein